MVNSSQFESSCKSDDLPAKSEDTEKPKPTKMSDFTFAEKMVHVMNFKKFKTLPWEMTSKQHYDWVRHCELYEVKGDQLFYKKPNGNKKSGK